MSDKDKIEAGDIVSVFFNDELDRYYFNATMLYVPCATGDSWRIRAVGGQIVYVQQFETMVLERKGKEEQDAVPADQATDA